MRRYLFVLFFILLSATVFADLEITVEPDEGWGNAPVSNIKRLCENVALHFQEQLRDEYKVNGDLSVVYYADGPIAFYRSYFGGASDEYRVGLKVTGRYWSKFSYQFGHEFCHIMQNHDRTPDNPNDWFEEAMCELANLWVLRRMSETWAYRPPYRNWADYRHHLADYADDLLNDPEVQYSGTGAEWLEEWEDRIRRDEPGAFTYERVSQLSYKFLPIFEANPEAWNAVRHVPESSARMASYMKTWHRSVAPEYKIYVEEMAEIMGIDIIPEDIYEDYVALTFTHETENSIVPINNIDEWDGWTGGIWEKTPDGTVGRMPRDYLRFAEIETWTHWMYSHAYGVIEYDITGKDYNKFSTYFGFANPFCNGGASMQLIAHADNVEIYRSKALYLEDYGTDIEFNIPEGTRTFTIEIDDLGNKSCDHYVLGEPKLFYTADTSNTLVSDIDADVNNDGYVDLSDVMIVRSGMTRETTYDTDVNNDGVTDEIDLLIVKAKAFEAIAAAAPQKRKTQLTTWGAMKKAR